MRTSILASTLSLLLLGCAAPDDLAGDEIGERSADLSVPSGIAVPGDQHEVLEAHALGFQVYECTAGAGGGRSWAFHAPAALLFDTGGYLVAAHFGGIDVGLPPGAYWQSTRDGSRVLGGNAIPSPVPGSIPQLRLQALDTAGDGIFTPVTFIHRLNTSGGVSPTGSCPRAGIRFPVFYQADYVMYAAGLPRPQVPGTIAVEAGHNLAHVFHAEGFQVYACVPDAGGNLAWAFRAPRAQLFDADGKLVVVHFGGIEANLPAGAYWQSVKDGSRVHAGNAVGSPNPPAIPELRLQTLDVAGTGILSRVSFIQRLETVGGVGPTGACSTRDEQVAVPYSADYDFYLPTVDGT